MWRRRGLATLQVPDNHIEYYDIGVETECSSPKKQSVEMSAF